MAMPYQPYEAGGIMGPRQKALIQQLQGGTAGAQAPGIMPEAPAWAKPFVDLGDRYTGRVDPNNPEHVAAQRQSLAIAAGEPAAAAGQKYRIQPVDEQKWNDPNKHDAKYDFLHNVEGFDPSVGFTPDVIAKLNALGLADWSGSGQRGGYSNVTDKGRQYGLEPGGFQGDFVQGFKSGTPQWAWDWKDPNQGMTSTAPSQGTSFAGAPISQMLQGNPSDTISRALQAYERPGMLQQLIAALRG